MSTAANSASRYKALVVQHRGPEPVPLLSLHPLRRPLFKAELRPNKAKIAGVDGLQFFRCHLDRAADFRELVAGTEPSSRSSSKMAARRSCSNTIAGSNPVGCLVMFAAECGAELGPGGCTLQQRWREAVVFQWQAIAQCLRGVGRAMNAGDFHQAIQQRIVLCRRGGSRSAAMYRSRGRQGLLGRYP